MKLGYARVSTSDQNPQLQIDALNKFGCNQLFTEHASGAQRDRPELQAALKFARTGDLLVVWKLDRLARSLSQLLATSELLEQKGVGLVSLTEQIDTSTPGGKLVFQLFGALAEFERSLLRERTRAGLVAARAAGRQGGRPSALPAEKKAAAAALLQSDDLTVLEVAAMLGVSDSTLYRHFPAARALQSADKP
jgi:DNA invertase Pin-like site-specific DNA recombinase